MINKQRIWLCTGIMVFLMFLGGLAIKFNADAVLQKLWLTAQAAKTWNVINHILFLVVLMIGWLWAKGRAFLYPLFGVYLAVSVSMNAFRYGLQPNKIIFPVLAVLFIVASVQRKFTFDFTRLPKHDLVFGGLALLFGFWYLDLVDSPIWLNALVYSPVGAVNCPTMLTLCGILILNTNTRMRGLELLAAAATFTFGMLGLSRMDVHVDIVLGITACYMVWRIWKTLGTIPNLPEQIGQ